ncbi:MAG: DUF937 domain-containing protein, partial [Methylocystis sp.]|nr:DUF937 domain-containing protein [Methylocystis sp.]
MKSSSGRHDEPGLPPITETRMSYLEEIFTSAQGGELLVNLGRRFGLSPEEVDSAVKSLAPALEIGMQNAIDHPSVFGKLIGEMASPSHHAAYDVDDDAHADGTVAQSRDFLATLFGSEDAAGQVVQLAARDSGLQPGLLNQLLPVL